MFIVKNILVTLISLVPAVAMATAVPPKIAQPKTTIYDFNHDATAVVRVVVEAQHVLCDSCPPAKALTPFHPSYLSKRQSPQPAPPITDNCAAASEETNTSVGACTATQTAESIAQYVGSIEKALPAKNDDGSSSTVILFRRGSAVLPKAGIAQIREAVAQHPGHIALVKGYTCKLGTKSFNRTLARARAKSVARKLTEMGVEVKTGSAAQCCYVSKSRNALNRRVEIHFESKEGEE